MSSLIFELFYYFFIVFFFFKLLLSTWVQYNFEMLLYSILLFYLFSFLSLLIEKETRYEEKRPIKIRLWLDWSKREEKKNLMRISSVINLKILKLIYFQIIVYLNLKEKKTQSKRKKKKILFGWVCFKPLDELVFVFNF